MKYFSFLFLSFFILGCSRDKAFDRFTITPQQKLTENSIQSSKLQYKKSIDGLVNVVYLNEILPKEFHGNEYFYVYLYTKDKHPKLTFLLNKKPALEIKELENTNRFATLTSFDAPWSKYYLVVFRKQGDILKFKLKNKQFNSNILQYEKNQ